MDNLNYLFNPERIAVIGASSNTEKIGYAIVDNIVRSGFAGGLLPVNPRLEELNGLRCYPSIRAVGEKVDLAVIAVPASRVVEAAEDCGAAGVRGLIVITAGFKETGRDGLLLERELLEICQRYTMRLVGPNCVGVMDTHTPLNASFARGFPEQGNISFISQSGAMLVSILDWSFEMGMGFSRFISLGNKADLNEIDFIESCAADPQTRVILCYVEDITDGSRFVEVCTEASKNKPIIILKSGTSASGAQAASSHTGALAGSDRAYEAAFRQCGVLRAESMNELFDLARAFATQPLPGGQRVGIVTNAGGPAIVATDSVEQCGLKVARFRKDTIDALRGRLPQEASVYNPVDIIGDAREERYRFALRTVLEDDNVDSALVLLCPAAVTEPEKTASTIAELKDSFAAKPVTAVYMGGRALREGRALLVSSAVPTFTFPEPAVRSLEGLSRYAAYLERTPSRADEELPDINRESVRKTLSHVHADRRVVLLGHEASSVMEAYGIPASKSHLAESEDEAWEIGQKIGLPVALKISSPRIAHKTDVGGVEIGLHTEKEVRRAYQRILDNVCRYLPDAPVYGVEIQSMVQEGVEVIIGMSRDIQFGPLMVCGLGGIYVNLIEDAAFRLATGLHSKADALEMISETKVFTLLKGYRGKKPSDIDALLDAMLRAARLVIDFPEITEMDINPVRVHKQGATALDVKITIE